MTKNRKFNEDKELEEIFEYNSDNDIKKIKGRINEYLPNELKIKAKNENQIKLINSIRNNQITICAGPPGTGKTYVSVAFALSLLRKMQNRYKKIYLVKSVTPLKEEEIGFLKGDLKDKFEPYILSYTINIEKIIEQASMRKLMDEDILRPFPLAFMRGVSLDDCIIIADEIQNISIYNSKTIMTRIGENCKLILLGDMNQIDMKNKKDSSLEKLMKIFKDVKDIGVIDMGEGDFENIRNPLITVIEEKFNNYFENKK